MASESEEERAHIAFDLRLHYLMEIGEENPAALLRYHSLFFAHSQDGGHLASELYSAETSASLEVDIALASMLIGLTHQFAKPGPPRPTSHFVFSPEMTIEGSDHFQPSLQSLLSRRSAESSEYHFEVVDPSDEGFALDFESLRARPIFRAQSGENWVLAIGFLVDAVTWRSRQLLGRDGDAGNYFGRAMESYLTSLLKRAVDPSRIRRFNNEANEPGDIVIFDEKTLSVVQVKARRAKDTAFLRHATSPDLGQLYGRTVAKSLKQFQNHLSAFRSGQIESLDGWRTWASLCASGTKDVLLPLIVAMDRFPVYAPIRKGMDEVVRQYPLSDPLIVAR